MKYTCGRGKQTRLLSQILCRLKALLKSIWCSKSLNLAVKPLQNHRNPSVETLRIGDKQRASDQNFLEPAGRFAQRRAKGPRFRLGKHEYSDVVPKAGAYSLVDDRMLRRWIAGFRICKQSTAARETLQTQ